jgi:ABC-type Fe3+/spermidine/putrescine transport system ATPase subunit
VLAVEGLRLSRGGRTLFDGLELALRRGERLSLCGPSGCGKTTLLRTIAGLERPDAGRIWCRGLLATDGARLTLPPWRRGLQMVFQDLGLWPMRSVRQNVLDAARAAGRSDAAAAADAHLARLGLTALAARKPGSLSGGEARRLALARALVALPHALLLDEPFASLDPDARREGFALLDEVLARTDAAVLLVTHDPSEAERLGGRRLALRDGRLGE